MAEKTGGCMCGAVRFTATDVPESFGICHCEMCRRWAGSALMSVEVPTENLTWQNEAQIATLQSSRWAERAWCRRCGTGLYFRQTMEGTFHGTTDIPLGLFDDPNGFRLTHEIFIDHKPDGFSIEQQGQKKLTRQECVEKFPQLDEA
jgi:hypothetical protein